MIDYLNPYYDTEKLELEMLTFDEPGLSYRFNTLCFWATKDGRVYSASDSGCSCPTPFEEFAKETQAEVLQLLERVGSVEQAVNTFNSWKPDLIPACDRIEVEKWIATHLKK